MENARVSLAFAANARRIFMLHKVCIVQKLSDKYSVKVIFRFDRLRTAYSKS